MIQKLPAVRHARVAALFATVFGLAACGGGGGGSETGPGGLPAAPAPGTGAPVSLADCTDLPTGVSNRYLNGALDSAWARREWKGAASAEFPEATVSRHDYAAADAATPSEIWYFKSDAGTRTVLGREKLNADGSLATRVQFVGWVESRTLAAGASETVNYTVKSLVPAQADTSERLTRTFSANHEITLPGGRLNTCTVDTVRSAAAAGGALAERSRERLHYAPGLGVVKRYLTRTHMEYVLVDKDQTYVNELVQSSQPVTYLAAAASTTPSLAQCSAILPDQTLQYTAGNPQEALSDKRFTLSSSFNGAASTLVSQRSVRGDSPTRTPNKISYFDPAVGALRERGFNIYAANGSVSSTTVFSGRPDLTGTAEGQTVSYTETANTDGTPVSSTDSFTFIGHEKVATYAGEFDTCKVRFDYGDGNTETYYLAPDVYWVRLDATVGGVRTTREMVKLN